MYKVVFTNAVSWILLLCLVHSKILPSEALPDGAPSGDRWEARASGDNSEREVYDKVANSARNDRNIHKKPVTYIKRGRLYNRNGYVLRIKLDGTVDGSTDKNSPLGRTNAQYCFL